MHSEELLDRFERYLSQITGKPFSVANCIKRGIEREIKAQYPNAKPGDAVTLQMTDFKFEALVGENLTFAGQTIQQIVNTYGVTEAQVEDFRFKEQLDRVGTQIQANYLDIGTVFRHPLSDVKYQDGKTAMNLHAYASMLLHNSYLTPPTEVTIFCQESVSKLITLTPEVETQLRDRYLPTIYQVCTQLVDQMTLRIERGDYHA
jgi:hypothetical protein